MELLQVHGFGESVMIVLFIDRKTAHMLTYTELSGLFYWVLSEHNINVRKNLLLSISYCFLYAISDEIHQIFVPGRGGEAMY